MSRFVNSFKVASYDVAMQNLDQYGRVVIVFEKNLANRGADEYLYASWETGL